MNEYYKNEEYFLKQVTEKIRQRITEVNQSLSEGQKEIENMHEYYWEKKISGR